MKMLQAGFNELAKEIPELLPKFSTDLKKLDLLLGSHKTTISLNNIDQFYSILYPASQAFEFLKKNYKGESKFEDMEYAFISGILSVLDPHSNVLPPKAYEEFKTQTQGEYGGLGIVINLKDNELTIVSPIDDTPASRSSLQPNDKITQIGDQSTTNMTLTEAVDLMRGPPNTKITLKIKSKNKSARDVVLTREVITIKSVEAKLITYQETQYGIIKIKGFQEDTYRDVVKALYRFKEDSSGKYAGIILDMRNNPGGLLDQAIMIADKFLSSGDIVITTGAGNIEEEVSQAKKQAGDVDLPMIVLINQGSASASEIVAGALKNNDRALVMGQKSFGKGSVQSLFNLRDGSSLKLTVAQYLTPGRESIQAVGIYPDIHLYPSIIGKDFFDVREDTIKGEGSLDAHLDNSKFVKVSKSTHSLTFLEIEGKEAESTVVSKIKENDDFQLQLSLAVLHGTQAKTKSETLQKLPPIIKQSAQDQDQKITVALNNKNIDWSKTTDNQKPKISTRYEFLDSKGGKVTSFIAGTDITFKVYVKNNSSFESYRVIANADAINPLIDEKEFVFGKLNPGEEKSATNLLKVPSETISFTESIDLNIYAQNMDSDPVKVKIPTKIIEKIAPKFSYSYKIIDGGTHDTKGNKNGIPEKGENISIEVSIKNIGQGKSEKTLLNIKNKHGRYVFLKKARADIGALDPNQIGKGTLQFTVNEEFDKDLFELNVFAVDDVTKTSINDTLKFNLKDLKADSPSPQTFQTAPKINISKQTKQNNNKFIIDGTAIDTKKLKDITIFASGKKIFYSNFEKKGVTTKHEFHSEFELEDGLNLIIIRARGERNLTSHKTLSVVYHPNDAMVAKQN